MRSLSDEAFALYMHETLPEIWHQMGASTFPLNCCTDTCEAIVDDMNRQFEGSYYVIDGEFGGQPHTWIVDDDTEHIYDPTIGQFIAGPAWRIVRPDDPLYVRYVEDPN